MSARSAAAPRRAKYTPMHKAVRESDPPIGEYYAHLVASGIAFVNAFPSNARKLALKRRVAPGGGGYGGGTDAEPDDYGSCDLLAGEPVPRDAGFWCAKDAEKGGCKAPSRNPHDQRHRPGAAAAGTRAVGIARERGDAGGNKDSADGSRATWTSCGGKYDDEGHRKRTPSPTRGRLTRGCRRSIRRRRSAA